MNYLDILLEGIDENGTTEEYSIADFNGEKVLLYFYPKDNTSGCTIEAHNFKENMDKLSEKLVVIGVSPDDIKSHKDFQKEHELNFILLSDPEHKLAGEFDTWENGKIERSTFLINEKGELEKEWRNVEPKKHIEEILEYIK